MLTLSDILLRFSLSSLFSAFKYFFFLSFYCSPLITVGTYVGQRLKDLGGLLHLLDFQFGFSQGLLNEFKGVAFLGVRLLSDGLVLRLVHISVTT
jgi:hypothetical protein